MKHIKSYIDPSIKTPTGLPQNIYGLLNMLEEYDKKGNSIFYFDRLDDLWVNCKNAIAVNYMSRKDWEVIKQKYWIYADTIYDEEMKNEII